LRSALTLRTINLMILLGFLGSTVTHSARVNTAKKAQANPAPSTKQAIVERRDASYRQIQLNEYLEKRQEMLNKRKSGESRFGISRVGNRYHLPVAQIQSHTSSAQTFFQLFQMRPVLNKKRVEGFVIQGITDGSLIQKLGFENGDVIHQVEQYKLDSISTVYKAFLRIKKSDKDKITIHGSRNGKSFSSSVIRKP